MPSWECFVGKERRGHISADALGMCVCVCVCVCACGVCVCVYFFVCSR